MSAGKALTSGAPANGRTELAEQATEGMLGPNPFVGLRAEDIVAGFRAIGEQAVQNPTLMVESGSAI
jgi:poly[(R)-3-hydroxyalkanoate] polymerase subunit PhaC